MNMTKVRSNPLRVLCINPWIYDFTAYDFWSRPLGLLYLAALLQSRGVQVNFIDCLDKWHPLLLQRQKRTHPKLHRYGTGHFHREIVAKPACFDFVPRHFARYGLPEDIFRREMSNCPKPDVVLLTSFMTYWYPGVQRVAEICRELLPGVPVILGGIYATLMPEHARQTVAPDYLVRGPGEEQLLQLLAELFHSPELLDALPQSIDELPYPAFGLYRHPDYYITMTSRGCPFRCTFCATYKIDAAFSQRRPEKVVEEIIQQTRRLQVRDVAFYDDALLMQAQTRIKPLLQQLRLHARYLRFHTPNGLHGRYIDEELAHLMYHCNFKTIRISLESVAQERRRDLNNKITPGEMTTAVRHLVQAGYASHQLETYVIMGLPGQALTEVMETILYAHSLGVKVRLASFSPIPGTEDFKRAVAHGHFPEDADPLLSNKTIIPLYRTTVAYERFQIIRRHVRELNAAVQKGLFRTKPQRWRALVERELNRLSSAKAHKSIML